jgi:hypothetical protein
MCKALRASSIATGSRRLLGGAALMTQLELAL